MLPVKMYMAEELLPKIAPTYLNVVLSMLKEKNAFLLNIQLINETPSVSVL